MSQTRRQFLSMSTKLILAGTAFSSGLSSATWDSNDQSSTMETRPIRAIAFDAFPIFDPRPIFALAGKLFPVKGKAFSTLWRTRIFEYTWLRATAHQYQDFWACIEDALVFTAKELQVELTPDKRQQLMQAFLHIKAFPDVLPALTAFKKAGIKLAFLSNMTEPMLSAGIKNSALEGYFDFILSTDRAKTFKPDPKAYHLAPEAFRLNKEEIAFAAFASWDATGAKWFGFPTVWINRLNFAAEALNVQPDAVGNNMETLRRFVLPTAS